MYLIAIKDLLLDEFFLYEYNKCPLRAVLFAKRNYVGTLSNPVGKKSKRFKSKQYVPHDETLEYKILKSIYYKTFELIETNGLNFNNFKELALIIIQKEINAVKRKNVKRTQAYYDDIQKKIFTNLENHFNLINEFDMSGSIDKFISLKADLREYLIYREKTINFFRPEKVQSIDWDSVDGSPHFLLNFINIKKDEYGISIVMTSPFDIEDDMVHRNFYISFIIQYIYYMYPRERLSEMFGDNLKPNIDKLIVYYPLKMERKEYSFKDINGIYSETEMISILRIVLEKLYTRTYDTTQCKYCENREFCYHRTNAKNHTANQFIFQDEEKKIKTII